MQRMFVGAFTLLMSVVLLSFGVQAAQVGNISKAGQEISSSLVQNASYGSRCKRWAYRCREAWGFGTHKFRKCMRRHSCTIGNRCDRWKSRCRRTYGYGFEYRSCMRRHNCYVPKPVFKRCKRWKFKCREAYGYKTRKYFRCMRRHSC